MAKVFPMFSGSEGNATYIGGAGGGVLVDAGASGVQIINALAEKGIEPTDIKAIFITHEHSDHIKGLKIISKYHGIPVYAALGTAEMLINDVPDNLINVYKAGDTIEIENIKLSSFETPHDSRMSTGYIIEYNGRRFGYATDMGMLSRRIADMLAECEAVVVESNYDRDMLRSGPYPYVLKRRIESNTGHLDNCDCARLVSYLASHSTERVLLAHLSAENNTPEIALKTVKDYLECKCLSADVSVADRYCPTRLI